MDELDRHIVQLLHGEYSDRIAKVAKSTRPLFYKTVKGEIKIAGSSVFVMLDYNYYLISAAHVLAENLDSTFTKIEYEEIYLSGNHLFSPLPITGNRDDDKIDLFVMRLDKVGIEKLLTWYLPVTEEQIGIKHQTGEMFRYFLYGYPITRTRRKWGTDEMKVSTQAYAGNIEKKFNYGKSGFDNDLHLAIQFDGHGLSIDKQNLHLLPDLTGISGSGLWYFDTNETNQLLGIVIQRVNQPGQKVLIAIKIEIVIAYIFELLKRFE